MIIKKIIDCCKKNGQILIFENDGEQWISDGYALYPLLGMPLFEEDTICNVYDIPAKKAEKMRISFELQLPAEFNFEYETANERPCIIGEPLFGGITPITTSHGMEFIQSKYLLPFADSDDGMLYIFERTSASGRTYFAVKVGFYLVGIILPYDCIDESFVRRLREICKQCEITLSNKQANTKD